MKDTLTITVNHRLEEIAITMSGDKYSNLAMLATLMKAICKHYDMTENELLGVIEDILLEEEE